MNKNPDSKGTINRREFVRSGSAAAVATAASACGDSSESRVQARPDRKSLADGLSEDAVLELASTTARAKLAICHHCGQSTFLALQEVFGLEGDQIVKALTPLPGIAERGETCGAVTASLLALGIVYGRDYITDWETWRESLIPARAFCERFEQRFGSTNCAEVVHRQFGERFDLYDPDDLQRFQAAGPTEKCGEVVGEAARFAAALVLEADKGSI